MTTYFLLYVDDTVLTASSSAALAQITRALQRAFYMKDLGPLHYFLGISVSRSNPGLFLYQRKYLTEVLHCAHMTDCNP